jgi:hypothetical protein
MYRERQLACPVCQRPMREQDESGMAVAAIGICVCGVYIEPNESEEDQAIQELSKLRASTSFAVMDEQSSACPSCGVAMKELMFEELEETVALYVSQCNNCESLFAGFKKLRNQSRWLQSLLDRLDEEDQPGSLSQRPPGDFTRLAKALAGVVGSRGHK